MKILIGLMLILAAIGGILDATGILSPFASVLGNVSILQIVCGLILLVILIKRLTKGKIPSSVLALSLLFMVFEHNIAELIGYGSPNIINNWLLLGLTIVLCVGLRLVLPSRRFGHTEVGHKIAKKMGKHGFGVGAIYIDSGTLQQRYVENNMGAAVVRFENPELYLGGGILSIENNMGAMQIFVPSCWSVDIQIENNMGHIKAERTNANGGPLLIINGENNMGAVEVILV